MRPLAASVLLCVSVATPVGADCAAELGAGLGIQTLSGARADWHERYLEWQCRAGSGSIFSVGATSESRFDLTDGTVRAAWYRPLGADWGMTADAAVGPDAVVLPEATGGIEIARRFEHGWVGYLGLRRHEYTDSAVTLGQLTVERYFGRYRSAWVFSQSRIRGGGGAPAHRLHLDRWYGADSRVGLIVAFGREAERIDPATLVVTDVRGIALHGRHWFSDGWGLDWAIGVHDQGDLYTRRGWRFGARYRF